MKPETNPQNTQKQRVQSLVDLQDWGGGRILVLAISKTGDGIAAHGGWALLLLRRHTVLYGRMQMQALTSMGWTQFSTGGLLFGDFNFPLLCDGIVTEHKYKEALSGMNRGREDTNFGKKTIRDPTETEVDTMEIRNERDEIVGVQTNGSGSRC